MPEPPRERVAEHLLRVRGLRRSRFRVDLHGVGVFHPDGARTLIRWEAVTTVVAADDGVTVRSSTEAVLLPPTAFRRAPADLAELLERARSITARPEVIGDLAHG